MAFFSELVKLVLLWSAGRLLGSTRLAWWRPSRTSPAVTWSVGARCALVDSW
jgi:hypothetical protein